VTNDLVKRLRDWPSIILGKSTGLYDALNEAADRIEQLEAALREIASIDSYYVSDYNGMWWTYQYVARKALEGKDD
jgi:hypothetical protein